MLRRVYLAALASLVASPAALAVTPYMPVPIGGGTYVTGPGVMRPFEVFGKEYSNSFDEEIGGVADPEQVISWDGKGGTTNAFDYDDVPGNHPRLREVDAIANHGDFLFDQTKRDLSHLLFSHDDTVFEFGVGWGTVVPKIGPVSLFNGNMIGGAAEVSVEESGVYNGIEIQHVWAIDKEVNDMPEPDDVDGLEVWGPEPPGPGAGPVADANRYSLEDDLVAGAGTSVWNYDPGTGLSTPYIPWATIVSAVESVLGTAPTTGENRLDMHGVDAINLDAMMIMDGDGVLEQFGGPGDSIIFSINQIVDPADLDGYYATGSELFVIEATAAGLTAGYLDHGGHTWSHSYTLGAMGFFDAGGQEVGYIDINAIEAIGESVVPEPSSIALVAIGLVALAGGYRRRTRG